MDPIDTENWVQNVQHKLNIKKYGKFNILYLNINSLRNKITELEHQLPKNRIVHIIALTEIRIFEEDNIYFNINNYQAFFNNRVDGHGGCALFIHSSLLSREIYNACKNNINALIIRLLDLTMNIVVVYKQPVVKIEPFLDIIDDLLSFAGKSIFLGDFNLDLLKNNSHSIKYRNTLNSRAFRLLNCMNIDYSTRIGTKKCKQNNSIIKSNTSIDHVFTNCNKYEFILSLTDSGLSDHKQINLAFDDRSANTFNFIHRDVEFEIEKINDFSFRSQLMNELSHCDDSIEGLVNTLNRVKHNPTEKSWITRVTNPHKTWVNQKLISLIDERDRYAKLLKRSPNNGYLIDMHASYTRNVIKYKNCLMKKSNSYKINKSVKNPKKLWKSINEIIYNKCHSEQNISCINNDAGEEITNKKNIANEINKYFCNIGKSLHDKFPSSNENSIDAIDNCTNTIFLRQITTEEIVMKITELKLTNNKSDIISAKLLKMNSDILAPKLAKILNSYLVIGVFPNELKCARVVPIFKSGDPTQCSNYRPISLLNSIAKIYEMLIFDRLQNFIKRKNIINKNQFGFQTKSGTTSAATVLVNSLQTEIDKSRQSKCSFSSLT